MAKRPPPFMPASDSPLNYLGCLIPFGILALLLYNCSGSEDRRKENAQGVEAIGLVKARLRDPASASFDQLRPGIGAYCGIVNANNGFGGKAGPQRFIVIDGVAYLSEDGADFNQRWKSRCS